MRASGIAVAFLIVATGASVSPLAVAEISQGTTQVVVGRGETPQGTRWVVKAAKDHGGVSVDVRLRTVGGDRSRGVAGRTPECGQIGVGSFSGNFDEVVVTGPITRQVGAVQTWLRTTSRRHSATTQHAWLSKGEALALGVKRRFGWWVSSAAIDLNHFRHGRALAFSTDGERYRTHARFDFPRFGCGRSRR